MELKKYFIAAKAIIKKDAKIFFRYPANAVFRIVEPMIWITPVYFLSKAFQVNGENIGFSQYSGTTDYMAFLVIGSIVSSFISSVLWGMGFSLKNEMDAGVIESNWLTPIPLWVQLVGRSIFSLFITTINALTVAFLVWIMFGFSIGSGILASIVTLLPMLIALYGLGFGIASLVLITNNANNIIDISDFSLSMLSGQSFPITVLPRFLIPISLALPITYGYDAIRGILLDTNTLLPLQIEQLILVLFMIIGTLTGYRILKKVEKYCKTVGNIGFH
ncbi:ABC transporter permease [Tepidimicrobium xylanilyticum]|uniref:Transport permease protein n=1 Tax=Tepidimicrobium xylanilyticum TaxID=1123352 RepID=A0A1H2ZCY4_9FIRM|nr:ABC transporter permease [Tepidimicrobium xylanilyticum]SDX14684.1 ABC-2 type transport system permease protein [Tepidimicrobium xylanilyticum]